MQALRIVALCVAAAVLYGVVHDQVTARVCIEYFTIGHPRLFASDSPTLHGIAWGVLATWWVGLLLGLPLAFVSVRGSAPPGSARSPSRPARTLVRPLLVLLAAMATAALALGLVGYALASAGTVVLLEPLASRVPAERHAVFIADLWAHSASYAGGFLGGLVLIVRVARSRRARGRDPQEAPQPTPSFTAGGA